MIFYYDIRMLLLDGFCQSAEECWASYTSHVLEAYLWRSSLDEHVCLLSIILHCVDRRACYAQCGLRCHAGLLGPVYGWYDVTLVVETAEYTWYVDTLGVLHFIHQAPHVVRHGVHTQRIEATVEHVGLYANLVERLAEGTYSIIRVFAREKIDLLKRTAIGLDT